MFEKPISINYIKKAPYFGSFEGISFAFVKKDEDTLEAYLYQGPYNFDTTPEEKKLKAEFKFSNEGYEQAIAWMNEHFRDYKKVPHGRRFDIKSIEEAEKG